MAAKHKKADFFTAIAFHHIADGEEVTQRFGHFFVIDTHETIVHPDIDKGFTGRTLTLRNLVFMVRELQIHATAVNIEVMPEAARRHRGTFDVPARTPFAPRRSPGWLT